MTLQKAISRFGIETKSRLSNPVASGEPENQLRGPLEGLIADLAELAGLRRGSIVPVGETSLADLKTRPDYAVTRENALVGFIEVKAPGKGADPRRFRDSHDRDQWAKLQGLPNLIYTDGNGFSLWRDGQLEGAIVPLRGDVATAGRHLAASDSLLALFVNFFQWEPQAPRSAAQLAVTTARLCRLLREEVKEQLGRGSALLTNLATDWRKLLFPSASDEAFADGYAQAVTFGLLMARARDITLAEGLDRVARELRQTNTLVGAALRLLTDETDIDSEATLKTSLKTLTRVLDAVQWSVLSRGNPDAWLYFYEDFLSVYDNNLRKKTGSYYTPPEVVNAMVGLVDEALRGEERFGLPEGLASSDVTVADPAIGTGTFLLGVLRRIGEATEADQGPGAVPAAVEAAAHRLIGFEVQFGPFAVAQLRVLAELQTLLDDPNATPHMRLFVTDTLGNPYVEEEYLPQILMPLGESRRQANAIKRHERITVVIGNPPYKEKALGLGGWIESGSPGSGVAPPLERWMPPTEWKVGAHAKHLRNLYVYFWRWATWKVFGDGEGSGNKATERRGIVAFITVAGFLHGPGFEKMRAELRRDADEIWVVDCSPEGHQPDVATRIFQDVQQPVCIVMAMRNTDGRSSGPARVRYRVLPTGDRQEKFAALGDISLDDEGWSDCSMEYRGSFFPKGVGEWSRFPALEDLFIYNGSGVMTGRTWVIAPDRYSLERRWEALQSEVDPQRKEALFHPHLRKGRPGDKHVNKRPRRWLAGHETRTCSVAADQASVIPPVRYAYRSFDRQWIIPDGRLINQANPGLWRSHSEEQVYMTALRAHAPRGGPAVTFCGAIPDLDHYKGSFGGRVLPLWGDERRQTPNVMAGLLRVLSEVLGAAVSAPDVVAYLAAVAAHPGYTARFARDLVRPGLRVPMTAESSLFGEAVEVGREVVWLHCFGERFVDGSRGRPRRPPRMAEGEAPRIPGAGAIPSSAGSFPDELVYDATACRLRVGRGFVENVAPAVWAYEVSGKQVLVQWFSYRRRDRSRPVLGDRRQPSALEGVRPEGWLAEYTTELMNVLHVLGRVVALEPRQADLLDRICEGRLVGSGDLRDAGALETVGSAPLRDTGRDGALLDGA